MFQRGLSAKGSGFQVPVQSCGSIMNATTSLCLNIVDFHTPKTQITGLSANISSKESKKQSRQFDRHGEVWLGC